MAFQIRNSNKKASVFSNAPQKNEKGKMSEFLSSEDYAMFHLETKEGNKPKRTTQPKDGLAIRDTQEMGANPDYF